jgi:hypothetical protein
MPRPRPPFLRREVTRHGNVVWYVRKGEGQRIRIRSAFGTLEFEAEYQAALSGTARPQKYAPTARTAPRIYFIECGDYIKIGFASSLKARLSGLTTGNPYPLKVLAIIDGDKQVERSLHDRFASAFHRGEWFRKTPELLTFIDRLSSQGDIEAAETTARASVRAGRVDKAKRDLALAMRRRQGAWDGRLETYRSIHDQQ